MELYAFPPLLTTNGLVPQPGAIVQFFAEGDLTYTNPLPVYGMNDQALPDSPNPAADVRGYINDAGGYKLATSRAVAKSGSLPAVPVYSVLDVMDKAEEALRLARAYTDGYAGIHRDMIDGGVPGSVFSDAPSGPAPEPEPTPDPTPTPEPTPTPTPTPTTSTGFGNQAFGTSPFGGTT